MCWGSLGHGVTLNLSLVLLVINLNDYINKLVQQAGLFLVRNLILDAFLESYVVLVI